MKTLLVVASAAVLGLSAFGEGTTISVTPSSDDPVAPPEEKLEEEDDKSWEIGLDADILTAYVWRNAVQNDRAVIQPCLWGDWTFYDPFYIGFYIFQNYDLSRRRRSEGVSGEWNETDFNVHIGGAIWSSEDEAYALTWEFGHEWYCYHVMGFDSEGTKNKKWWPTTYEWYGKLAFENPYLNPYGQASWDYMRNHGWHFELGLEKEKTLAELTASENETLEQFSVFADWNMNFGTRRYLSALYGDKVVPYFDEDAGEWDYDTECLSGGIGGTTLKLGASWNPCDHFSLGLVVAYTHILNDQVRANHRTGKAWGEFGPYSARNDLVWGGIQAKLSF